MIFSAGLKADELDDALGGFDDVDASDTEQARDVSVVTSAKKENTGYMLNAYGSAFSTLAQYQKLSPSFL